MEKKLLEVKRGQITEREHFGYLVRSGVEKVLYKNFDDVDRHFYLRSCAKPMQSSVLQDLGVFDYFNFTSEEIAVVSSSHSGTDRHVEIVRGIFEKIGLSEDVLKCGVHPPLDKETRYKLIKEGLPSLQVHNNCSGKHVGFLSACVLKGWDIDTYLYFDHPLQLLIKERISDYCKYDSHFVSQDGCDAPITAMPLPNMCYGFLKVFINYPKIADAFAKNPELIGGKGRIDTEIIRASKGRLLSKVGAEGLCMVFNTENKEVFAVKISDSNQQARAIVLIDSLNQLGWLSDSEIHNNLLNELYQKDINTFGKTLAGRIYTVFKIHN